MPPIQLHVLGPAFGAPSIDPECNAAIALCQQIFTSQEKPWEIIPSHAKAKLPCLTIRDSLSLHGYTAISKHLTSEPTSSTLTSTQQANETAISHFLHSSGQPLLDTSLYLPYENYTVVRSAFTHILPWHTNYILPPSVRAAAKSRTRHLGLSAFDLSDDGNQGHEDTSNRPSNIDTGVGKENQGFEAEAQKRASLLLPRKETLRSLLQRPENAGVFKLKALADAFLGPLDEMLGEEDFLLGTSEPASVDFLAYGFLSLMLFPALPQGWLRDLMERRHSRLAAYTRRLHGRLGLQTEVADVMALAKCTTAGDVEGRRKALGMALPWSQPLRASLREVLRTAAESVLEHIPLLAPGPTVTTIAPRKPNALERYFPTLLGLSTAAIAASVYYAFSTGRLVWPHGEEVQVFGRRRFADYGHLGAALAGLSVVGQQSGKGQSQGQGHDDTEVEMGSPINMEVVVRERGD
ncbi:hypothetical protein MBLNU230_g2439t1 [Neophaeotheca triangularis]